MSSPSQIRLPGGRASKVNPASSVERPLGRPMDQGKYNAIIEAATLNFFTHGYSKTSIEGIAAAASVSKVTVYNHFASKPALFKRVVEARCEIIRKRLVVDDGKGPIDQRLRDFGHAMTDFLAKPDMVRFEIGLSAEAEREPELGANFFDSGPRRLHSALADMLDRARERGELEFDDAELAAEHLGSMFKGLADLERRMRLPVDPERTTRRITSAVDLFMRANGTHKK